MVQPTIEERNELTNFLEHEIDYFRAILQFSEKSLENIESLSINVLTEMIHFRQEWIEKIQEMDNQFDEIIMALNLLSQSYYA